MRTLALRRPSHKTSRGRPHDFLGQPRKRLARVVGRLIGVNTTSILRIARKVDRATDFRDRSKPRVDVGDHHMPVI